MIYDGGVCRSQVFFKNLTPRNLIALSRVSRMEDELLRLVMLNSQRKCSMASIIVLFQHFDFDVSPTDPTADKWVVKYLFSM